MREVRLTNSNAEVSATAQSESNNDRNSGSLAVHEKLIVSNKTEETATEKQTGDWIAGEMGGRRTRLVVAGGGVKRGGEGVEGLIGNAGKDQ